MRKKLYKSGKLWVAAAAASLAIAVGPNVVNADTTTPTTQTTTTVAGAKQSTSVDDNKVVTEVTGNNGVTSDNKTTTSNNSADNNGSKTDANGVGNPTDISNIPTDSVKINANGQTSQLLVFKPLIILYSILILMVLRLKEHIELSMGTNIILPQGQETR